MQQNIISLKTNNVPQTERKQLLALKKRPLFKIKQLFFSSIRFSFTYSFFLFLLIYSFGKSMSGRTLKAAQTVSTSQYKCTDSAKLQLKSVHKQSVKLLIFFFFVFYTVSFIYNKNHPFTIIFHFLKKNHMVHPNTVGPGGKNRPYKASV